ncbi:MAG: hypothetical protein F6K55_40855 [Moorea sp. SIO4A3]|nr:hypothetical protein [Moorena sp. SIO4A3]
MEVSRFSTHIPLEKLTAINFYQGKSGIGNRESGDGTHPKPLRPCVRHIRCILKMEVIAFAGCMTDKVKNKVPAAGGQWLMIASRLLANLKNSHCPPYD